MKIHILSRHYFYLLLLVIIPRLLFGQAEEKKFYFSVLNTENGFTQNSVSAIFQDSEGYLWFGTQDGLNRYDGYEFKTFRSGYNDTNSLSGNHIFKITEDKFQDLWILTNNGINRMERSSGKIRRFPARIKERVVDMRSTKAGEIVILTPKSLLRIVQDTFVSLIPASPSNHFTCGNQSKDGTLYIGTQKQGVLFLDATHLRDTTKITPLAYPHSENLKNISQLHVDEQNRVWVEILDKGIFCSDSLSAPFRSIPDNAYAAIDKNIRAIIDLDSTFLLLGTFNGLFMINKKSGAVFPGSATTGGQGELNHFSILSLYKDRQGTLWVGTNLGGVNYHNSYNNRFHFIKPIRFSGVIGMGQEDREGMLWFATEGGGLLSYNPASGEQQNYLLNQEQEKSFNHNIIKAICIAGDSIFCTTHRGEVYLFSISARRFSLFRDYGYNNIFHIHQDVRGNIWIPTYTSKGMTMIKDGKETNKFQVNGKWQTLFPISTLYETTTGRMLFGTRSNSFYCYNLHTEKMEHFPSSRLGLADRTPVHVLSFHEDSDKNTWVTTLEHGIFILDSTLHPIARQPLRSFKEKIFFITESPRGYFWLTGQQRLYRYHLPSGTLQDFNADNGMVAQEFAPSPGLLSQNGVLYLSGNKGINVVNTRQFPVNPTIPKVLLTALRVNNREIIPHPGNPLLAQPLSQTPELSLKHDETNIAIDYTALNLIYPHNNQYAYKLDGLDADWIEAGNRREAIYSNLSPGRYTFRVRASNNDGVWNMEGTTLHIRVKPPIWQSWWAYLAYLLATFLVIRQYFLYRQRKLALENQLYLQRLEQKKSEELHHERLRLFTHIAHEIRTPLMLIINPLDEMAEKTSHISGLKEIRTLIQKNTQRLLSLTNNLLDIQKHEGGNTPLHPVVFDFQDFIQDIFYAFRAVADNRRITFCLQSDKQIRAVVYDREELEKVLYNLLSNAFKFTPPEGSVTLSADIDNSGQWLTVRVEDSGIGISPEEKQRLFEPFSLSKKDLHGEMAGSGIGLSVALHIVEQHHGELLFEDAATQGTIVSVRLPYHPAMQNVENHLADIEQEECIETVQIRKTAFQHYKLLIVDDNEEIVNYLRQQLEREYNVHTASNGKEAIAFLETEMPDLIISDVMMPEMDGIGLCRILKNRPEWCHIPILLLTAKAMSLHIEEGYDAGADDYLIKPFKISTLKARIDNILVGRSRLREIYSKKLSLKSAGIEVESIDNVFMEKYISIVKQNISNPTFSIETVCHEFGMSRAAFYRKFKALTSLSPAEMIRNIRLECATELLTTTPLTVSEIAYRVGFSNDSYFCNFFKSIYGVSPAKYKESLNHSYPKSGENETEGEE